MYGGTVAVPLGGHRSRYRKTWSALVLATKGSLGCWGSAGAPRPSRTVRSRCASTQRCNGPVGARAVPSRRPVRARCRPGHRRPSPTSRGGRGRTASAMASPRPIAAPSAWYGAMSMARPGRVGPTPRGVHGPGWGTTAAQRAGTRCAARPAPLAPCCMRRCSGGKRRRCPPCRQRSARWQPAWGGHGSGGSGSGAAWRAVVGRPRDAMGCAVEGSKGCPRAATGVGGARGVSASGRGSRRHAQAARGPLSCTPTASVGPHGRG
jgi:hypothetical protein